MVVKKKELRGMTKAELDQKRDELRKQLFEVNVKQVAQQLENTSAAKYLRRDLARVLTIVHEDELGIRSLPKQGAVQDKAGKKDADNTPKKERKK